MAQFDSNVLIADDYSVIGGNSKYGLIDVLATTSTEATLGVSGNTSVLVTAVEGDFYLGLDNTVSDAKYFRMLKEGETIQLIVSTSSVANLWVYSESNGKIAILEGVN